jgi:large subunit ribosomal protein L10
MALSLQEKEAVIATVSKMTDSALSAVIANPSGVSVDELNKLRKKGRDLGVYMRIVRNTLMRRVVQNTQFSCLADSLVGPTLIAYSLEEPGASARLFRDFAEENKNFEVTAISFEGRFIPASQINILANLPTYKEAVARLLSTMKEAVAGKLVRTLTAICRDKETA